MTKIDEKLEPILAEVLRRNAGETEFHQEIGRASCRERVSSPV